MRVLHVVKTSDGGDWAAVQAGVLRRLGVDVHVALPRRQGIAIEYWEQSGATIHIADLSFPTRQPGEIRDVLGRTRRLLDSIQPDVIHSHFVTTTLTLRLALGRNHRIPRVFQVPGPLHLEHWPSRHLDIQTAGKSDYWIASSRFISNQFETAGVPDSRVFLSYYSPASVGTMPSSGFLRGKLALAESAVLVGNINFIYPPKYLLGHRSGLKGHEIVIDALGMVTARRPDVYGVLIGTTFGRYKWYEQKLRERADRVGGGRIIMPGYFTPAEVRQSWSDFNCAVHAPSSENCGGVLEPLLAGVPVVASRVGGLPELVINGITGKLVESRTPQALASAILRVLANQSQYRALATTGGRMARVMFDADRTGAEILGIYRHLTAGAPRPSEFAVDFETLSASGLQTMGAGLLAG